MRHILVRMFLNMNMQGMYTLCKIENAFSCRFLPSLSLSLSPSPPPPPLTLSLSYVLRSLLYRGLRLLQLQSFLTFVRARLIHFVAILIYPLI